MSTSTRVQVECPACHASIRARIVGIGRRLPCPHCGQPVLLSAGPGSQAGVRPVGMDVGLAHRPSTNPTSAVGPAVLAIALLAAVGAGWWYVSSNGPVPGLAAWPPSAMAGGALLLLAVTFMVSSRAAATLIRVFLPLCCVGFLVFKALGPGGVLAAGPLRLLAAQPGEHGHGPSAVPPVLLEFLPDPNALGDPVGTSVPQHTAVAEGATPVTFILDGVSGIDVGATVRRSLSSGSPGVRPSWSITTRGTTAMVTLWMVGDFEHVATTLALGREKSRDAASRRVVIEVDPARCVRRR